VIRAAIHAAIYAAIALCAASCADLGEVCRQDDDCGGELICHRAELDEGQLADEGVCGYPRLALGDVCAVTDECDANLFCSNDLPSDVKQRFGRCVDAQPSGAPCSRDENCASGLVCEVPDGAETGSCVAAPEPEARASHAPDSEPRRGQHE
jgi:hypothetical protein